MCRPRAQAASRGHRSQLGALCLPNGFGMILNSRSSGGRPDGVRRVGQGGGLRPDEREGCANVVARSE